MRGDTVLSHEIVKFVLTAALINGIVGSGFDSLDNHCRSLACGRLQRNCRKYSGLKNFEFLFYLEHQFQRGDAIIPEVIGNQMDK